MALINTNGLALIGPGSEWFWASAQFFVVAVTLLGVYRQLRVQAGANAFNIMQAHERDWDSERMTRAKLDVLLAWRDGDETYLGVVIGLAGILYVFTGSAGLLAVNGLGLIIWFAWLGIVMLRGGPVPAASRSTT